MEGAIVGAGFNGDLFDHSVVSFHLWWGKGVGVGGVEDSQGVAVADARYFCVESIWWVLLYDVCVEVKVSLPAGSMSHRTINTNGRSGETI